MDPQASAVALPRPGTSRADPHPRSRASRILMFTFIQIPTAIFLFAFSWVRILFKETRTLIRNRHTLPPKAHHRGACLVISFITFVSWLSVFIWAISCKGKKRTTLLSITLALTLTGTVLLLYFTLESCRVTTVTWEEVVARERRRRGGGNTGLWRYLKWCGEEFGPEVSLTVMVAGMLIVVAVLVATDKYKGER